MNLKKALGFVSIVFVLICCVSGNKYYLFCLLAAFIHELGHIIAAKKMKININDFNFGVLGARLNISGDIYSYRKEIILAAAGPAINILSAFVVYLLFGGENSDIFIFFSVMLAFLNLLPIQTFDGGRILECALLSCFSINISKNICTVISFVFVFVLWTASVYFLLIYSSSINLFIFSAALFASLFVSAENERFL